MQERHRLRNLCERPLPHHRSSFETAVMLQPDACSQCVLEHCSRVTRLAHMHMLCCNHKSWAFFVTILCARAVIRLGVVCPS